jgi:hypothetical protein
MGYQVPSKNVDYFSSIIDLNLLLYLFLDYAGMFKFISKNMKSGGFSGTKRYLGDLGKTVSFQNILSTFSSKGSM